MGIKKRSDKMWSELFHCMLLKIQDIRLRTFQGGARKQGRKDNIRCWVTNLSPRYEETFRRIHQGNPVLVITVGKRQFNVSNISKKTISNLK